jgi:hypothetical protein
MTLSETPPHDWATKHDLALLEEKLETKLENLELRFESKLANTLRTHTYAVLGGFTVIATALTVINKV